MYYSISTPAEPWRSLSLQERCVLCHNAVQQNRKLILYISNESNNSSWRYRVYNIYQTLLQSQKYSVVFFFESEISAINVQLPKCSFIVIHRSYWTPSIQQIIDSAKRHNRLVVYDTDDYIFDCKIIPLLCETTNQDLNDSGWCSYWFSTVSRSNAIAQQADAYLATNNYLGTRLSATYNRPAYTIFNSINDEQLAASQEALLHQKKDNSRFRIGYFSGSPSHANDLRLVSAEIADLMKKYTDIEFFIVGFMQLPDELKQFANEGRLIEHPLVDMLELQRLTATSDVNIAPLVNNEFTNCKSELKYFEAACVNVVTVATPIYTYAHAIEDGVTGFLCEQGQFAQKIELLYNNPALRQKIAAAAHADAIATYHGRSILNQIETAYDQILQL